MAPAVICHVRSVVAADVTGSRSSDDARTPTRCCSTFSLLCGCRCCTSSTFRKHTSPLTDDDGKSSVPEMTSAIFLETASSFSPPLLMPPARANLKLSHRYLAPLCRKETAPLCPSQGQPPPLLRRRGVRLLAFTLP